MAKNHNHLGNVRHRYNVFAYLIPLITYTIKYKKNRVAISLSFVIAIVALAFLPYIVQPHLAVGIPEFNFVAVGDWGCNSRTQMTVTMIKNIEPAIVLGLGDYSYKSKADCWLKAVDLIDEKMKIAIGNHDDEPSSKLQQYMDHFDMKGQYYSFNYQNMHFLALSTEPPHNESALQYFFVNEDLAKASSNRSIDWIIVYFHKPMYTSPSNHEPERQFRDLYHPLFDKYDVDLVIQAHNHNYERSYPIKYNNKSVSEPIIINNSTEIYYNNSSIEEPRAPIFVTAGTAGKNIHFFEGKAPYIEDQYAGYGILDVKITDNGKVMKGRFYAHDGSEKDRFTIMK